MTRKTLIALAAAAICMGAPVPASAQAEPPPGLDRLHAYCQARGHLNSVATDPKSVWSWRCVGHRGELHRIDMHDACKWHTNGRYSKAAYHDANNAFSWYCY
ncbi:hypothetical protein ABZ897_26245 [Nonomuraea sp. NPDC046802]|uniref:hypothetical protein n=1 Tax=Nonomuraea sp. NPDC046802 TaxID=3154919 RepID=UPI0033E5E671